MNIPIITTKCSVHSSRNLKNRVIKKKIISPTNLAKGWAIESQHKLARSTLRPPCQGPELFAVWTIGSRNANAAELIGRVVCDGCGESDASLQYGDYCDNCSQQTPDPNLIPKRKRVKDPSTSASVIITIL